MAKREKRLTKTRRREFLEALAKQGNVSAAARAAGVSRSWVYEKRALVPSFAREWDDAEVEFLDTCKSIADRRATIGEAVTISTTATETDAAGKVVSTKVTEEKRFYKSDRLLAQLLDRRHPDYAKAAARRDLRWGGGPPVPVTIAPDATDAEAAAAYLEIVRGRKPE